MKKILNVKLNIAEMGVLNIRLLFIIKLFYEDIDIILTKYVCDNIKKKLKGKTVFSNYVAWPN